MQPIATPAWQAYIDINLKADIADGAVFAMWYLVTEPNFDSKNTLNEFGFVDLFNGIGLFVYKKGGRLFMRAF